MLRILPVAFLCSLLATGFADAEQHTLLLGGRTSETFSTSVELITPSMTCEPAMAPLPVGRFGAAAAVLGDKIMYCGGYNSNDSPYYHSTCHSYTLGQSSGDSWAEEPSMTTPKMYFAMSVVGDRIYASGGQWTKDTFIDTLEYYTVEDGWKYDSKLTMDAFRYWHCSVAIGTELFVIGGSVGVHDSASNSVQSYDTSRESGWVDRQPLNTARYIHACKVEKLGGQEGIFVSGGYTSTQVKSVEFYEVSADTWRTIGEMHTARDFHTMTILGGQLVVAGGEPYHDKVETFDGTSWTESNSLSTGRYRHAGVSFPAGMISC